MCPNSRQILLYPANLSSARTPARDNDCGATLKVCVGEGEWGQPLTLCGPFLMERSCSRANRATLGELTFLVVFFLQNPSKLLGVCLCSTVSAGHGKPGKSWTLKFVFQAWQVMEFWFGSWKVLENETYCIKTQVSLLLE